MNDEEPTVYVNFVVDCNRKWKIHCRADNNIALRLQAADVFCEDWAKADFDRVVVYETGEELEDDELFDEHRNYMYLRAGEKYVCDPQFDLEKMPLAKPPARVPPKQQWPKPTAKVLEIYQYLGADKRYKDDKYWTYDEDTLWEIWRGGIPDLRAQLDESIEDRGAIPSILATAMRKWLESGGDEADKSGPSRSRRRLQLDPFD